jgi:hypothetical protein
MTPDEDFKARRRARAKVMAIILFGMVILFYVIGIAKMSGPAS